MILSNKTYCITIDKVDFLLRLKDTKKYDYVFNPGNFKEDDYHSAFLIKVETEKNNVHIALIGSLFSCPNHCAVLEDSKLIVLMNDEVIVFDLEKISILKHISIGDELYFSVYAINGGFLVHGELAILRLNRDFEEEWNFYGSDIWASPDATREVLKIINDRILLEDWNGIKYILDMDGNLIQNE